MLLGDGFPFAFVCVELFQFGILPLQPFALYGEAFALFLRLGEGFFGALPVVVGGGYGFGGFQAACMSISDVPICLSWASVAACPLR